MEVARDKGALHQKLQLVQLNMALQEELIPADKEAKFLEIKYQCKGRLWLNDPYLLRLMDEVLSFSRLKIGRQQIDGSVALWATMEVTSKAIMGIAWEGGGMDDGYRGSKIAALIPDDKNLERNSIDFDP
ncbi:hypothetical protein BHM03_00006312 [Ensete ventricosum]|nr:hypothetical protein BHM03_00006312 [Ensete ventricosum]